MINDQLQFLKDQRQAGTNVETSVRCALRCPQCQRTWLGWGKNHPRYKEIKDRIREGGDLSLESFEKIVKFSSKLVNLCGQISDPIYWPHLKEAVQLMKNYSTTELVISTAGHQKNIEWYKDIYEVCPKNVIWKFGLDGAPDTRTSEKYRIGQDSKLIWQAMMLAKEMGLTIEWQFIVFEHNVHELEEATKIARKNNIPFLAMATDRDFNGVRPPKEWKAKRNKEEVWL